MRRSTQLLGSLPLVLALAAVGVRAHVPGPPGPDPLREAREVLADLRASPSARDHLEDAHAVLLVTHYRPEPDMASGGEGAAVAFVRGDQGWTGPAFYEVAALGLLPRARGGDHEAAILLMSAPAARSLERSGAIAFNNDAAMPLAGLGGETILWTRGHGLGGGDQYATITVSYDREKTSAFHGRSVGAAQALASKPRSNAAAALVGMLPAG